MKKNINIILSLIVAVTMISCNKNIKFDESVIVAKPTWNCDSVVSFSVDIEDTTQCYQTGILVRNSGRYNYQNLWLFVTEIQPDSTVTKDTIQYYLADDYGRWLGSGLGSLYTNLFLFQDSVVFSKQGEYRYIIEHGMRVDDLDGINDIGLKVLVRE